MNLNKFFYLSCLAFLFGCAKVGYLYEQGTGQLSILYRARPNEEVLKDVRVSEANKEKIRLIKVYKKYFYEFFKKKPTQIYSKTTILESKAASYLLIASKQNEVKARKECFPIVGCFPYLGFYKLESAKSFAKDLKDDHYMTYIRPVYAYSTLGNFEDPILSSFFSYSKQSLAEVVFHELFHTILFIKDEVEFNETLANFIGKQMVKIYFNQDEAYLRKKAKEDLEYKNLTLYTVKLIKKYKESLKEKKLKFSEGPSFLEGFLEISFYPKVRNYCHSKKIIERDCYPLKRKWNHASMAAILTYENKTNKLHKLFKQSGLSLKEFYFKIETEYKQFLENDIEKSFSKFFWEKRGVSQ